MSRVAVNIVTYDSVATIGACLTGQETQTYSDFVISILDNASSDNTISFLAARSGIRIICSAKNIGYAAAHNCLVDLTNSDFVLTLNPDVVLGPNYLAEIVAVLDSNSELGSAAGCLLRVDNLAEMPEAIDSTGLFMRPNRRQGLRFEGEPLANCPDQITLIFGPDGAAACYRRTMLDDIRLEGEVFDSDFFMHKEDIDACWRAQLRGWSAVFVPGAVAHHIRSFRPGQRQRVDAELRFYGVRNRYLLMLKNEQIPHLFRDLVPILWYDFRLLGYLVVFERSSLRALRSVWKVRSKMLIKRRVIQAGRRVSWRALRRWFI